MAIDENGDLWIFELKAWESEQTNGPLVFFFTESLKKIRSAIRWQCRSGVKAYGLLHQVRYQE